MSGFVYTYYFLMTACFVISLFYRRFTLVKWLTALLLASIAAEAVVEAIGKEGQGHYPVYHVFVPVEYTLITLALRSQMRYPGIRKAMLISVLAFWPVCVYTSFFVVKPVDFPGTASSVEAVLVIAWSLLILVYIEPVSQLSIFRLPVFWVALAFLLYFSCTVALNSIYNYLRHSHPGRALALFEVINNVSNWLLYIFLTIGILCHREPTKKSLTP